jgi:RNA polymerase sigma-70 factor, ECF subfamily
MSGPPTTTASTARTRVAEAITEHLDGLYRLARVLTRDAQTAEDVVQETVVRALAGADSFRGDASVRTWLHRILHNVAIDDVRRSSHELLTAGVENRWRDDTYTVDAAEVMGRAEVREELEDALVRLPAPQRTAVVLHDVEGWTVAEIAAGTGVGLAAVKQRLRRGRMAMVTALASGPERRRRLEGTPMRCWDARRLVSDYLDGELPTGQAGQVEAHLERCPTCPPLYAALVGVQGEVGRLRDPDSVVPAPLVERIAGLIAHERPGGAEQLPRSRGEPRRPSC